MDYFHMKTVDSAFILSIFWDEWTYLKWQDKTSFHWWNEWILSTVGIDPAEIRLCLSCPVSLELYEYTKMDIQKQLDGRILGEAHLKNKKLT